MEEIQKLYAIERHITDNEMIGEAKLQYRKENAIPLLDELGKWMQEKYGEVLPKSAIGIALAYSLKRWDKLNLYATTSILNIDNNPVENSIRPVAVGRKKLFICRKPCCSRACRLEDLLP